MARKTRSTQPSTQAVDTTQHEEQAPMTEPTTDTTERTQTFDDFAAHRTTRTRTTRLPERFRLAADPDAPCEGCDKVRKGCAYCERCKDCCPCPICAVCGGIELGDHLYVTHGDALEDCLCLDCPDCLKRVSEADIYIGTDDVRRCPSCAATHDPHDEETAMSETTAPQTTTRKRSRKAALGSIDLSTPNETGVGSEAWAQSVAAIHHTPEPTPLPLTPLHTCAHSEVVATNDETFRYTCPACDTRFVSRPEGATFRAEDTDACEPTPETPTNETPGETPEAEPPSFDAVHAQVVAAMQTPLEAQLDAKVQAQVDMLLSLAAQGAEAIAVALRTKQITIHTGRPAATKKAPSTKVVKVPTKIPAPIRMQMRADRAAGMSYVAIDLKHGYEDAVQTRGRMSWLVCHSVEADAVLP